MCNKNKVSEKYDDNLKIYLSDINNYELLTKEEEKELFIKYKNGDMNAKDKLIKHNLRLVVYCVKSYYSNSRDTLDLIQEGNIGLIMAIDDFDLSYNVRFSTYAIPKIRSKISFAMANKSKIIKLPHYLYVSSVKLIKLKEELEIKLNREVSIEELASNTNMSKEEVNEILNLPFSVLSLDSIVLNQEGEFERKLTFIDSKKDEENPFESIENKLSCIELKDLIKNLDLQEKDKEIVLYRYGFIDGISYTRKELSEKFNLSIQRVAQIEKRALKNIMADSKIRNMLKDKNYDYYDNYTDENIYKLFYSYDKNEIDKAMESIGKNKKKIVEIWFKDKSKLNKAQIETFYKACYEINEYLKKNSKVKILKR